MHTSYLENVVSSRNDSDNLLEDTEAIGPNEVLALPSNIGDGAISPASSAKPTAAPSGAEVELQDTAVPIGTEVLHVYSTGLNGSLPRDLPAEQSAATVHLRGAYGPVCPRCMPTKAANLPVKQTCPAAQIACCVS